MKKFSFVIVLAIVIVVLIFGLFNLFFPTINKGALQVTSAPSSKVYLNDKYLGQTPLCKCESEDMQETGEYTIRLVPNDNSFSEFQEKIMISPRVLTVVDRKFGKGSESSGSIISLSPIENKKATELLVVSIPSGSNVSLDNNLIGQTPVFYKNPTESDHTLLLEKEGYSEKTVRIRTPLGYKLTVAAFLSTSGVVSEQDEAASDSAALSPSPTPVIKVKILDTPTGFLRVRSSPSIAAAEVAQVKPGEEFDLVSEQEGWFEIKMKDGKSGFISSQYVSK